MNSAAVASKCDETTPQSTVFIVDDDPDVGRTISLLVRSVDIASVEFSSADDFLHGYQAWQPGCLVLDMRMPGMTGLQLQKELRNREIELPIIFITAHGEIQIATSAMRAGAVDFLVKPYSPQLLLERIHEAFKLDRKLRQDSEIRKKVESHMSTLTQREREVMEIMVDGDSSKQIAKKLQISQKTVDNHRARVFEKMHVDNAVQLVHAMLTTRVDRTKA